MRFTVLAGWVVGLWAVVLVGGNCEGLLACERSGKAVGEEVDHIDGLKEADGVCRLWTKRVLVDGRKNRSLKLLLLGIICSLCLSETSSEFADPAEAPGSSHERR